LRSESEKLFFFRRECKRVRRKVPEKRKKRVLLQRLQ